MHARLRENELVEVFHLLGAVGIEPILFKGQATARCYADNALRPQGDIDLCVRPEQHAAARSALSRLEQRQYDVDLDHRELTKIDARNFDQIYSHSELMVIQGVPIRVLGPEDHLRALCLHFLKHGGWRPIWLCDIAAALETRPSTFDWALCLGTDARKARWILAAVALSDRLLGSSSEATPAQDMAPRLPGWFPASVLNEWSQPHTRLPPFVAQVNNSWRAPRAVVRAIRDRWPNPIQATINANADFGEMPRFPFQVLHGVKRLMNIAINWSVDG